MPRSRGRSAPAPRQQTRSTHSSAAHAPATHAPPHTPVAAPPRQAEQRTPGLMAQMASTAAGVGIGSAIGHTVGAGITSLFGGRSEPVAYDQPDQSLAASQQQAYQQEPTRACDIDARNFTKCLDENNGNMQICDWYLQQLKACQEAARTY